MNDRVNERESEFGAFKEWLQETADREDNSPDDVLNQLMSTYWILTELSSVIEETPYAEGEGTASVSAEGEADDQQAIVDVIESMAQMNQPQQSPDPSPGSAVDPGVIQLVEALRSESGSPGLSGASEYRLERLKDDVEDLHRDLKDVSAQSEDLEEGLGENEDVLSQLQQDVSDLEQAIEDGVDVEQLEALEEQVEAHRDAFSSDIDGVEDRFEDAYANIKRILEHLLGTSERNEDRIDAIVDVLIAAYDDLAEQQRDAEALSHLKRKADRQNIASVNCDHCDYNMDVALLELPRCPDCDRFIDEFEETSEFLRTTYEAKTRPERAEDVPTSDLAQKLRERLDAISTSEPETSGDLSLADNPE